MQTNSGFPLVRGRRTVTRPPQNELLDTTLLHIYEPRIQVAKGRSIVISLHFSRCVRLATGEHRWHVAATGPVAPRQSSRLICNKPNPIRRSTRLLISRQYEAKGARLSSCGNIIYTQYEVKPCRCPSCLAARPEWNLGTVGNIEDCG